MGEPLRVAVLGAGAAGLALAGRIALAGNHVTVANRSIGRLRELRRRGAITIEQPDGSRAEAGADVADVPVDAVRAAQVVVLAVNSDAQPEVVVSLAPVLRADHVLFLIPGHSGGAWAVTAALAGSGDPSHALMVECPLPFVCLSTGEASVRILQDKADLALAAWPRAGEGSAVDIAVRMGFAPTGVIDVLTAGLSNMSAVFHPALMLGNCARIETGERFPIFASGATPSVGALFAAVDAERRAVAAVYGVSVPSAADWLRNCYGSTGTTLDELIAATPGYRDFPSPGSVDHRFLREHVTAGLVPLAELARAAGMRTPVSDALIVLASVVLGTDLRVTGRNLEALLPPDVPTSAACSYFREAR
ncbi:NAD/NADP octopine/nopaline dehydrogenase family protein [Streptomyces sp. NPDC056361]|uniref:NAD/NADP octopine/nopaline dehydrogenase family protein n=1 Tax=Streptomyces sp. NPDC056361 TaxID=3345795 RepID=UPI0035D6622D